MAAGRASRQSCSRLLVKVQPALVDASKHLNKGVNGVKFGRLWCVLLTAIHKRRCDAAHDLVMSLMVDHVSEVNVCFSLIHCDVFELLPLFCVAIVLVECYWSSLPVIHSNTTVTYWGMLASEDRRGAQWPSWQHNSNILGYADLRGPTRGLVTLHGNTTVTYWGMLTSEDRREAQWPFMATQQ